MLRIDGAFCFFGALLLVTVPLDWLMAVCFAAAFHEICHILAIKFLGEKISCLKIGVYGAVIESSAMSPQQELVCAAAGPAGSLLLLFLCRWIPKIALCAGVQAVYNLLPVYPMDGGRILRCAAAMLFPEEKAKQFCIIAEKLVLCIAVTASFFLSVRYYLGIFPFFWTLVLFGKAILRKIPCKDGNLRVQ